MVVDLFHSVGRLMVIYLCCLGSSLPPRRRITVGLEETIAVVVVVPGEMKIEEGSVIVVFDRCCCCYRGWCVIVWRWMVRVVGGYCCERRKERIVAWRLLHCDSFVATIPYVLLE